MLQDVKSIHFQLHIHHQTEFDHMLSTKKVKKPLVAKHKFEDLRMTMYTIKSWGGDVCTVHTIELQLIQPIATRCWSSISDQITTLIICIISR